MSGALDGLRVVEVANYVAGPYAGVLLADLGADVIKLEAPPKGDPYRNWTRGNYGSTFCSLNRNKRSVLVDLRTERGQEVANALARRADVLIENSRPGAMDRLGMGFEALRGLNPRLIYCSITGFGRTGPYRDRPGYDTVGQALSGLLSLLTDMDAPKPMGISLSDHLTGLFACYGVLAALWARERTGLGQLVDTSLLQASLAFLGENMTRYLNEGGPPPSRSTRVRSAQVYACRDRVGAPFVIHLSSPDKFWHGLVRAIGRPELVDDPRFATRGARLRGREAIQAILDAASASATREEILARLRAEDVPCAPLNRLDEVLADEQVRHLGMIGEVSHPRAGAMRMVRGAVNFQSTEAGVRAAPLLGEDTDAVLAELGFGSGYLRPAGAVSA